MAYVYEHWRPDLNIPFWIGKGTCNRSRVMYRRNKHHTGIQKRLAELGLAVDVRIIADNLSEDEAYKIEESRIEFWRGEGIKLANMARGGRGGTSGCERSAESRAKQSATRMGAKLSEEHRMKIVDRVQSPEWRMRCSEIHTGRKRPPETGQKISVSNKKAWSDPETRERRLAGLRKPRPPVSEETRAKMRAAKTPEARAKISAAVTLQWEQTNLREIVSSTMKRTNAARKARNAQNILSSLHDDGGNVSGSPI